MNIKYPLLQFDGKTALIIVTGEQSAKLYLARDGKINLASSFKLFPPKYPDKEGFFKNGGKRKIYKSGAGFQKLELYLDEKFRKSIHNQVSQIISDQKVSEIYVFSPDHMIGFVLDSLPRRVCNDLKMCVYGNHLKDHPLNLVDRINQVFQESIGKSVPASLEARKILDKIKDSVNRKIKINRVEHKLAVVRIDSNEKDCAC